MMRQLCLRLLNGVNLRRPNSCSDSSTRNYDDSLHLKLLTNRPAKHCNRPRWSTKHGCDWSGIRIRPSTGEIIFSARPLRPCAEFSLSEHVASGHNAMVEDSIVRTSTTSKWRLQRPMTNCSRY